MRQKFNNPEQELQYFKQKSSQFTNKIKDLNNFIKKKEKRDANRDIAVSWLQEYKRLNEMEMKLESELTMESNIYFDHHTQAQTAIRGEKLELQYLIKQANKGALVDESDTIQTPKEKRTNFKSNHVASTINSSINSTSAKIVKNASIENANNVALREKCIKYLARNLENLEHDLKELDSDLQLDIENIKYGNKYSTLDDDSIIQKDNQSTEAIQDNICLEQRKALEVFLSNAVPPLELESTEIRNQFVNLIFDHDRKEQARLAHYKLLRHSETFDILSNDNFHFTHYLKAYKEFTSGRSDTTRSKSFLMQLHNEIKRRFKFRKFVYGEVLTKGENIPSLDELENWDSLFEKREKLKKKNREAKHTYAKQRDILIVKMRQTLQLTHEINEEDDRIRRNMEQIQQKQNTLHNQLKNFKKIKEEKYAIEKETQERIKRLDEEREMFIAQRRKKEREKNAKAIEQYHLQLEELRRKKEEMAALQRERKNEEFRRKLPEMKARTEYREKLLNEKRQKSLEYATQLKLDIEAREKRLETLRELVRPHIESDFDRATAPTESFLHTVDSESQIHSQYPTHGYSEATLLKDKRYKLQMKLQEAGLLHTQAAREMMHRLTDISKMRVDNLTTQQRIHFSLG